MCVEGLEASQHLRGTIGDTPDISHAVGARKMESILADRLAGVLQKEFRITAEQFSNLID